MHLASFHEEIVLQIETSLQRYLESHSFGSAQALKHMISYHMGWEDSGKHGKRIRPLITLLCTGAFGEDLNSAMPAALSIEFLHNFTLIHDDIEDQSDFRHNRETLWKQWGMAQAINAGDALFCISQLAMLNLSQTCGDDIAACATRKLNQVCLHLTRGQQMDIALETDHNTELDTYIEMIQGKTAALISLCTTLSGVITRQTESVLESLSEFGKSLGMAFQMQDDYLGIWGNPKITGKSVLSDLRTKKKTLPVLYGLQNCQEFKTSWEKDNPTSEQIAHMAEILTSCGAMSYVKDQTTDHTNRAFEILKNIFGASKNKNIYVDALFDLCEMLLIRKA